MISLSQIQKLAQDNSPALLSAIGVVGTIGTAVLAYKAGTKVERILSEESPHLTGKEKFELTWKCYIPPVVSGAATISCVVLANRIGSKRAAAMAAAYTVVEKGYSEYKEKVVELMGENNERKVRDEIVRDRIAANPQTEDNTVIIGSGDVLCYEMYTDRYFNSSVDAIKRAVNEVNYTINTHGYASLSDFYQHVGLPNTAVSEEMGWTSDKLMDVDFTTHLSPDGRPCVGINFMTGPVRNFHRFH